MDEGSLGVHKIELVINAGEDLSDGSGGGDHADSAHNLGEITTGNNSWWLVVDTALETSWAPVTNWMVLLVLMVATEALTSLGTTSPLYMRQQAMYLPWRGSHLAIMDAGS